MRKNITTLLIGLLITSATSAQEKPAYVPGELIVQAQLGKDISAIEQDLRVVAGMQSGVDVVKLLSPHMRAWLVRFDPQVPHSVMMNAVFSHPAVTLVQSNHIIKERNTPNDPQLNQQWQHINPGGNGATADADVDSDLAWDITTGGLTAVGDSIVVCVVDDGTNLTHPDLLPNLWFNHNEIPNNSIDDDNNGYVDDYRGWNSANNNDNVTGGSHGINVEGMIGAKGNNATGVVGVNWDVKIMTVKYGNIDEASVIASYTYPLTQRQLYESTGGQKGAFVVAINSSWGIDNGQPDDSPLWCAFYDTLGTYGILSAAATANNNVNIDNVGDLPTACPSQYLLSVTASNDNDVRTFSGYGQTTIDLAAPGEDVRTTSGANSYTNTSGTSFASPMVAGAIGLMYSAPCASLAAIAHASPQLAAEMVRDYILDGVDPKPNLTTECVTGGRLNLRNSLDLILQNCSGSGCLAPYNLATTSVSSTQGIVTWQHLDDQDTFNFQFGMVGSNFALVNNHTLDMQSFNQLAPCATWAFLVQAVCDGVEGAWSDTLFFTTDGCCNAPSGLAISAIADHEATVSWQAVTAAQSYGLRWRVVGTSTWLDVTSVPNLTVPLAELASCTTYEVQVWSNCDPDPSGYSSSVIFTTMGCGACTDLAYCVPDGNTQFEWVGNVTIGSYSNTSVGATAYSNYTTDAIDLNRDSTYNISLQPGYAGFTYQERFRIWVDLNQDGDLTDAGEMLYDAPNGTTATITGTLTVPLTATLGITRLRVGMTDNNSYPFEGCDALDYGEFEDYCANILIELPIGIDEQGALTANVYPNPASSFVQVDVPGAQGMVALTLIDVQGRTIHQQTASGSRHMVDVSTFAKGVYSLRISDANGSSAIRRITVR